MRKAENGAAVKNAKAEGAKFQKRIGSTIYSVSIHFSQTSKETIEDRAKRTAGAEKFPKRRYKQGLKLYGN